MKLAQGLLGFICVSSLWGCTKSEESTPPAVLPEQKIVHTNVDANTAFITEARSTEPNSLTNGILGVQVSREGLPQKADGTLLSCLSVSSYKKDGDERLLPTLHPYRLELMLNGKLVSASDSKEYRQAYNFQKNTLTTRFEFEGATFDIENGLKNAEFRTRILAKLKSGSALSARWTAVEPRDFKARFEGISGQTFSATQNSENPIELTATLGQDSPLKEAPASPVTFELDGPVEDLQAIRALYAQTVNAIPPASSPVTASPFGFYDTTYGGHVFWDADTWVFPSIALLDPARAAGIPLYRLAKNAVPVPWESSISGKDVNFGPMQKELHVTGDTAWAIHTASALGIVPEDKEIAFGKRAASYWMAQSVPGPQGREIKGVIGPDEFATVDNNLYTNLLAEWTVNTYLDPNVKFKRPRDSQSLLTRDKDEAKTYKQADVVLTAYPLQDPEAEKQTKVLLDRFEKKFSKNTPLMTDSVHALLHARAGDPDQGYKIWKEEILRGMQWSPRLLFREKTSRNIGGFVTGAGGCLQTVLYGFAGIKIAPKPAPGAKVQLELKRGLVLSVAPHLPSAWKSLTVHGLTVLGKRYTLVVNAAGATLKPQP